MSTCPPLEQAIVRHVGRFLAGEAAAHVLCPSAYDARRAAAVIVRHFPTLELGGPADELAEFVAGRSGEFPQTFRPLMVGSVSGMCLQYLRARLNWPVEASRFGSAIALVVNYDAAEMGRCLCCLEGDSQQPISSMHLDEFLSIYKETTHLNVGTPGDETPLGL